MIEIAKYKDYLKTTQYQPDHLYNQVTTNPTAIANLLINIDMLKENECLVIIKLPEEKF